MRNKIEDEIEFGDLIKNPIRLFGLLYPYFIIVLMAGGMFWVYNFEFAFNNSVKPIKLMRDTVIPELGFQKSTLQAGVDLAIVSVPTPELIAKGKEIFTATCTGCHGVEGKGDGIAGVAMNPKPRNFHSKDGWKNGMKFADIYKTIQEGISGGPMVSYSYIPIIDRISIIHYIQSTFMTDVPKNTPEELALMDQTYSLAKGYSTPNQIPVKLAIDKLVAENSNHLKSIDDLSATISSDKSPEAIVVKEYIRKIPNAISFLQKSDLWRGNKKDLLTSIRNTFPYNGFCISILKADNNDLSLIYTYLLKSVPTSTKGEVKG